MSKNKIRVGISIGDINGIGLEIIIKTFMDKRMLDFCTPIVYGSSKVASYHRKALKINDFSFNVIKKPADANPKKANLLHLWEEDIKIELGASTPLGGKYAFKSLEAAVNDLAAGNIDVLVTAPIDKDNIQSEQFQFPGHTEYLANYANESNPLMLMCANTIRVGVVTGHIALKDVASAINKDLIIKKIEVLNKSLIQDFGIDRPKIAVLGLNPHAGDNGLLGLEEIDLIAPAIAEARDENILAFGPYAADGLFGSPNINNFDGIIAMYHDQGLAPFKTIAFEEGVNYTAGLPIVRTSPDHGVGYDIAGQGIANESSFRHAVYMACDVFRTRKNHKELVSNSMFADK